jgi:hypothetical protein
MRGPAMFEQEDALPRSKPHFSIENRHSLAGTCQYRADMRGHVVAAFGAVAEVIGIFRHEAVEEFFQVAARAWIGIFHDDQTGTGVLDKNSDGPIPHAALVDLRLNVIGDLVKTLAIGAHFKPLMMHMHSKPGYFSVATRAKQGASIDHRVS